MDLVFLSIVLTHWALPQPVWGQKTCHIWIWNLIRFGVLGKYYSDKAYFPLARVSENEPTKLLTNFM